MQITEINPLYAWSHLVLWGITPIFHEFKHLPKNRLAEKKQSRDLNQNTATPLTTIETRERKTNQVLHFPKGAPNSLGLGAHALLVASPASSAVSSRIFQADPKLKTTSECSYLWEKYGWLFQKDLNLFHLLVGLNSSQKIIKYYPPYPKPNRQVK